MQHDLIPRQQHNLVSLFKLSSDLASFFQEKYKKLESVILVLAEHEEASQKKIPKIIRLANHYKASGKSLGKLCFCFMDPLTEIQTRSIKIKINKTIFYWTVFAL